MKLVAPLLKPKFWFFLTLAVAIFGLGLLATGWWFLQPISQEAETVRFTVPKGQAITIIGQRLTEAGLIRHPLVFRWVVAQGDLTNKLQAGSFELSAAMTPYELADRMTQGTDDVWVTILEGWRVEEIAEMLAEQDLPAYDKEQFLELAKPSEGYLFPDTYLVPKQATAQLLYDLLTGTFERKVDQDLSDEIAASSRPLKEVVILASLLEREAKGYEEMRHVAGILENRLQSGIALQVDATLQYVKGYNTTHQDWWVPPLAVDKELNSPFNTYLNPGLPPKPIAKPSLDAIKAALDPMETDDLFYIHGRQGEIHYAETLEEHNQNIAKYL